jgi:hypothetical protein
MTDFDVRSRSRRYSVDFGTSRKGFPCHVARWFLGAARRDIEGNRRDHESD